MNQGHTHVRILAVSTVYVFGLGTVLRYSFGHNHELLVPVLPLLPILCSKL